MGPCSESVRTSVRYSRPARVAVSTASKPLCVWVSGKAKSECGLRVRAGKGGHERGRCSAHASYAKGLSAVAQERLWRLQRRCRVKLPASQQAASSEGTKVQRKSEYQLLQKSVQTTKARGPEALKEIGVRGSLTSPLSVSKVWHDMLHSTTSCEWSTRPPLCRRTSADA